MTKGICRPSISVLALMMMGIAMFISCSDDKEETQLPEPQELMNEEPVASHSTGQGEGTVEAPFVAEASCPAEVTLVHKSTYNDPDGTTYTCEPKATIQVTTAKAEVQAKTIAELTDIKVSTKSDSKGTNPLVKHTEQTFTVGGQTIIFDLTNEIYTHTDSRNRTFEMPYTRLSTAKYGAAQADEATRSERTIAVTGIRLVPITPSRGSITTQQAYRVSVAFTVDTQTENTDDPTKNTYSFLAEYDATVETTTEYPDPSFSFSYHADATQGSNSTQSPWTMNKGMNAMTIQWDQQAAYTYFDTNEMATKVVSRMPKAAVSVSALKDTLWVSDLADLEKITAVEPIITTEGENPLKNIGKASFTSGEQVIDVEWNYESYPTVEIDGKEIAWPYIVLGTPEVIGVSVTDKDETVIAGKEAKVVEVSVRIKQNLSTANIPEDQKVSEDVEYIVKYIGVVEIRLVKVVYRKDWEWIEPHDNIMLAYYPMVHRDRIYSNGETFTDTFRDAGHVAGVLAFVQPEIADNGGEREENGITFFYNPHLHTNIADSIITHSGSVVVPKLSLVKRRVNLVTGEDEDINYLTSPAGAWNEYITSKLYDDSDIPLDGVEIVGTDSVSTQPSGWYFYSPSYEHSRFYEYDERAAFIGMYLKVIANDQFLVIDGQMINFLEFREPATFNLKEENITMPNGAPGMVVTYDAHLQFLGRNFYGAITDTIYQRTPAASSVSYPAPQQNAQQRGNSWQKTGIRRDSRLVKLPPPYKNLPSFEYGGDPFGGKR